MDVRPALFAPHSPPPTAGMALLAARSSRPDLATGWWRPACCLFTRGAQEPQFGVAVPHGSCSTGKTEAAPQPFRYSGAYVDPTGLYNMGALLRPPDRPLHAAQYASGCPPWPCPQPGTGNSGRTTTHSASVISLGYRGSRWRLSAAFPNR
jgi:hypothetical protein